MTNIAREPAARVRRRVAYRSQTLAGAALRLIVIILGQTNAFKKGLVSDCNLTTFQLFVQFRSFAFACI